MKRRLHTTCNEAGHAAPFPLLGEKACSIAFGLVLGDSMLVVSPAKYSLTSEIGFNRRALCKTTAFSKLALNIKPLSDLHLEFGSMALSVQGTDVVVAAGDIGVGMTGLKWLQRLPCKVVYVAGNHEYWGEDLYSLVRRLNAATQRGNVHFLEKRSVIMGDVRFIGCTLWSDFKGADASIMEQMWLAMNDFSRIYRGPTLIRPPDLVSENSRSRDWLEQELSKPFPGKTVVVTHHAPLLRSWYRGNKEAIRYAYCNDLQTLMDRHDIDLWVHGHVHDSFDYLAHGVRVVCNPRGYFGYKEVGKFDTEMRILL